VTVAFGEYRPDVSDYNGEHTRTATNVLPRGDGYGPFQDHTIYTDALPAACRGFFRALKSDGSIVTFAGTSDRLFRLNNTDFSWIPVSKVAAVTSISNATPAVVSYTAHGFVLNDPVVFSTSGALPAGLTAGTVYYVISAGLTADAFQVSLTAGGAAINTTDAGSGTHSVTARYTALTTTSQWQFEQAGDLVFATQANTALQVYNLTSGSAFSNSLGSPPQAAYIKAVGRFLVLSGLTSTPYRIQWSGLNSFNASDSWTSGVASSDYQDFPDGGIVRGVAGGEYGIIFQDAAIRRMTYAPGSAIIFDIDRMTDDMGLYAPYSLVRAGSSIFFRATQGFFQIDSAGQIIPIGKEKFDRTFIADVDAANLQLFIGASDPRNSRVFWAYKSISGSTGLFDKLLCYDYGLQRASTINVSGEYLASLAQSGLTLDALDSINTSIDALPFSLDDVASAAAPEIAAVNSAHKLGYFGGSNLEATIATAERGAEPRRLHVRAIRPLTDAETVYCSVSKRERQGEAETYTTETVVNRLGKCPQRASTRYSRAKVRIPAGESWTYATGVEPDVVLEGQA
jgi:hypothetical protein